MIKLKDLLKESTWSNRKFGEPLPTMEDYKKAYEDKHEPEEEGPKEPKTNIPENPFDDEEIDEEKIKEDFKNNKWEVYVADEKGKEKIMKVAKSKRAGVILYNKLINTDKYHEVGMRVIKEGKLSEDFGMSGTQMQPFSSKEAKTIVDSSLRDYAKVLRKAQYQVVKDWMSKAKAGKLDYYDLVRGLQWGDVSRAHPYETKFLFSVLNKEKIIQRFQKYFGGKKSMNNRLVKKHKRK